MKYLAAILICIGIAGVVMLGVRLSSETLGILAAAGLGILGGACGAIPVSVILVWALIRRTQGQGTSPTPAQQPYPPVLIVGGNGQPWLPGGAHESPFNSLPAPRREFRVVPADDDEDFQ